MPGLHVHIYHVHVTACFCVPVESLIINLHNPLPSNLFQVQMDPWQLVGLCPAAVFRFLWCRGTEQNGAVRQGSRYVTKRYSLRGRKMKVESQERGIGGF